MPQFLQNPIDRRGMPILPNRVQTGPTFNAGTAGFQGVDPLTGAPPTGLIGAENALTSSADNALNVLRSNRNFGIGELRAAGQQAAGAIGAGRDQATGFLEQGVAGFDPFTQSGNQAGDIQAALAGAFGVQAQQEALANLKPVSNFLQERGERAVLRNASAMGGVQGGNVMRELTRFGQGLAGESAQQQFNNLSTVADRGFSALREQGALRGQQGNVAMQAGRDIGDTVARTGESILGARLAAGRDISDVFSRTGSQLASGRTRAGEQIAGSIGSAQSNLANLLSGAGQQQGASQGQLAALLANLATQHGSQVAGLPGVPGTQQTNGILQGVGQAATGVGMMMAASDIRLKENIHKVGVTNGGHNLYAWDWNKEGESIAKDQPTFGVIAQEVREKAPSAVSISEHGYMMVDYSRIH